MMVGALYTEVRRASAGYTLSHASRIVPYALPEELEHFLTLLEKAGLID